MLLPTVFLGAEFFVADVLVLGVLEASFEGVLPSCVLGRVGVFESVDLQTAGFLLVTSDFGVSGFDFVVECGRLYGDATGFLDAGVAGLVTSEWKTQSRKLFEIKIVLI